MLLDCVILMLRQTYELADLYCKITGFLAVAVFLHFLQSLG